MYLYYYDLATTINYHSWIETTYTGSSTDMVFMHYDNISNTDTNVDTGNANPPIFPASGGHFSFLG